MSRKKTLNDDAWENLFSEYDILNKINSDGSFLISAEQIKEFREPRLMAKFDHTLTLPQVFIDNKLSILPVNRGEYVISHFDAYHKFEPTNERPIKVDMPSYIKSIDYSSIHSETIALNCAFISGIIQDFTDDENIVPTVSGRMSSGSFDFEIKDIKSGTNRKMSVENSQIEIDAAYEGINFLSLFEAKRYLADDFLVRQLYYPYRTLQKNIEKEIKSIFLVYSNGIYRLYQYIFEDPNDYSSLVLVKQRNYSMEDTTITSEDIQNLLHNSVIVPEPKVTFPQANVFERVISLCEMLNESSMNRNDITVKYAFDSRQTNYYTDAALYLDLVHKEKHDNVVVYSVTEECKSILNKGYKQRQLAFCQRILSYKVFNNVLKRYFETGVMPSQNEIIQIMKKANLSNIKSPSTYGRRASSVKSWINWIVGLINE